MEIEVAVNIASAISVEVEVDRMTLNPNPVSILNQADSSVISMVAAGGSYSVIVADGVIDNGSPYTNSIINP